MNALFHWQIREEYTYICVCVCRLKLYFAILKKGRNIADVVRPHRMVTATSTPKKGNSNHLKQGTICKCKASTQNFGNTYFALSPQWRYSYSLTWTWAADVCGFTRKQVQRAKISKKQLQHRNLSFLNCAGQSADHSKMYGKETR